MFGYADGEGGPSGRKREQGDRAEKEQSLWPLGSLPVSDLYGKRRNELGFFSLSSSAPTSEFSEQAYSENSLIRSSHMILHN